MRKTVYIHIGAQKTGSTAIQNFAFSNSAVLRTRGLHVVSSRHSHHGPLYEAVKNGNYDLLNQAVIEIREASFEKFFISFEGFYRLEDEALKEFLGAFSNFDIKVIFIVRRRSDRLRSGFAQGLKINHGHEGEAACKRLLGNKRVLEKKYPDDRRASYLGIVRRWQRALEKIGKRDSFELRVFERDAFFKGDLLLDFFLRLGVVGPEEDLSNAPFEKLPEVLNPSISPAAQYLMALMYLVGLNDVERRVFRRVLIQADDPDERRHSIIADDVAAAWDVRSEKDDAVLAREFFGRDELFQEPAKFVYAPPKADSFVKLIAGIYERRKGLAGLRISRNKRADKKGIGAG